MKILSILTHDARTLVPPDAEKIERMNELIEEMRGRGILIDTGGAMPGSLEMQITRKNGRYNVTDGPFAETKEVVGGFALLEVSDREEAIAMTRRFLDLAGDATCHLHEVCSA